jgi:hypothetical protein
MVMQKITKTVLLLVALYITGCTSTPSAPIGPVSAASSASAEITTDIERFSDGEAYYAGLYNNFSYRATILNSAVRTELLRRQNEFYQWDREKFSIERDKSDHDLALETVVFLSFFTPDRKNDNLAEDKSIWRVYLEAGSHRYIGKVKKLKTNLSELQALYPYHSRWNTAYEVTFSIPANAIEGQASRLTITGPLGNKVVNFAAVH